VSKSAYKPSEEPVKKPPKTPMASYSRSTHFVLGVDEASNFETQAKATYKSPTISRNHTRYQLISLIHQLISHYFKGIVLEIQWQHYRCRSQIGSDSVAIESPIQSYIMPL
jgi:hypothetical protein